MSYCVQIISLGQPLSLLFQDVLYFVILSWIKNYVWLCSRWPRAASHCRHVLSACVEFVLAQFVWRIFPNNYFLFCHNDDHFRTIAASGSGATETLTSSEAASVKGVTSNKLSLFVLLFMFAGSKCKCKLVLS